MILHYILQTNLHNIRAISHQIGVLSNLRNVIFPILFFLFMPVHEFSVLFYCTLNSALELRICGERCGTSSHFYIISSAF
jgi:hypothetical protein